MLLTLVISSEDRLEWPGSALVSTVWAVNLREDGEDAVSLREEEEDAVSLKKGE